MSKLSREERVKVGLAIAAEMDTVEADLSGLHKRWEINESYVRNRPGQTSQDYKENADGDALVRIAGESAEYPSKVHAPLIQPIVDTLTANICGAILGQQRYCTATAFGRTADDSQEITKEIQFHADNAHVDQRIIEVAKMCATDNLGLWRVRYDQVASGFHSADALQDIALTGDFRMAGLVIDVIHPRDFVHYPIDEPNLDNARLVAHRWRRMHVNEVEEYQEAGRFLEPLQELTDTDGNDGMPGSEQVFALQQPTSAGDDKFVSLWAGLRKHKCSGDKAERWYEFVFARETKEILYWAEYELPVVWYVDFRLEREYGRFYPANSVPQNIQQLQVIYNELVGQFVDGSMSSVYPVHLLDNSALIDQTNKSWMPNEVVPVIGNPAEVMHQVASGFNGSYVLEAIQYIRDLAERVARVSANDMASESQQSMTATQSSIIAQGSATSKNHVLNTFGIGLTRAWSIAQLLISRNYDALRMAYGDAMPMGDDAEAIDKLSTPCTWSVTGTHAAVTPEARSAAAQNLLQLGLSLSQMGIHVYRIEELARIAAEESGLPGYEAILMTEDEQQQIAAAGADGGLSGVPGMAGDPQAGAAANPAGAAVDFGAMPAGF